MRWGRRSALLIAAVVVVALYLGGTFDHALVNIGLNAKPCARNGFGATFCGKELTEYRARLNRVNTEAQAAQSKIQALQRQGEEDEQRAREAIGR